MCKKGCKNQPALGKEADLIRAEKSGCQDEEQDDAPMWVEQDTNQLLLTIIRCLECIDKISKESLVGQCSHCIYHQESG
jgi:hypothetical protein